MSAEPAFAVEPEFSDGDGDSPTSAEIAALLAAVLNRVRERGPFFKQVVDEAIVDIQKEGNRQ